MIGGGSGVPSTAVPSTSNSSSTSTTQSRSTRRGKSKRRPADVPVGRLLNRLLGLPIHVQNAAFELFVEVTSISRFSRYQVTSIGYVVIDVHGGGEGGPRYWSAGYGCKGAWKEPLRKAFPMYVLFCKDFKRSVKPVTKVCR